MIFEFGTMWMHRGIKVVLFFSPLCLWQHPTRTRCSVGAWFFVCLCFCWSWASDDYRSLTCRLHTVLSALWKQPVSEDTALVVKAVASYKFTLAFNPVSSSSKNNHTFFQKPPHITNEEYLALCLQLLTPTPPKKKKKVFPVVSITVSQESKLKVVFLFCFGGWSLLARLPLTRFPTVGRLFFPVGPYRTLGPVYLCPEL